jgi:hypothetical protein
MIASSFGILGNSSAIRGREASSFMISHRTAEKSCDSHCAHSLLTTQTITQLPAHVQKRAFRVALPEMVPTSIRDRSMKEKSEFRRLVM